MRIFLIFIFLVFISCNNKQNRTKELASNNEYLNYVNKFSSKLTKHFPKKLPSEIYSIQSLTYVEKNDVGLILIINFTKYERFNKTKYDIVTQKYKAIYNNKNEDLLKINSFETKETSENLSIINDIDTNLINQPIFKDKLPIPNFIEYSIHNNTIFWEDENFDIYVIDADTGKYFEPDLLKPNIQMPSNWKNGFSRGYCINKNKFEIIYWLSIW